MKGNVQSRKDPVVEALLILKREGILHSWAEEADFAKATLVVVLDNVEELVLRVFQHTGDEDDTTAYELVLSSEEARELGAKFV